MRSKDQRRAADAYTRLQARQGLSTEAKKRYGATAHKLPVLIRSAGLAQALAFVNSRGKPEQHQLIDDIAATYKMVTAPEEEAWNRHQLAQASRDANLTAYMRLTQEVLAVCLWYKRFAESVFNVEAGDDEADERQPA